VTFNSASWPFRRRWKRRWQISLKAGVLRTQVRLRPEDIERALRDEADLCRNEGVTELADLLDNAGSRIEYFMRLETDLRAECMSMAMELTK